MRNSLQLILGGKMSTAVVSKQQEVLTSGDISTSWTPEKLALLKRQFCQDLTNDEFDMLRYAIQRTGLDPFMRQIYAVKRKGKLCIQVGIDGYRLVADRTGVYAGCDDAIFDDEENPNKAIVTVYKIVQGQRCAFTASARWNEYYPGQREGFMWDKMPCVMLAKVAEALALRKAFPADLSGTYTEDEMAQADASPEAKISQAKPVQVDAVSNPLHNTFKMTSDRWKAIYKAADANGYPREQIKPPSTEHEYRRLIDEINQCNVAAERDITAEIARMSKDEEIKAFSAAIAEQDRRRLEDIEAYKGCFTTASL